jgi:hypothetical protein
LNRCSDPTAILDSLGSVGAVNERRFRVLDVVRFKDKDE